MADFLGPPLVQTTDSWSCTEVRSMKHTHSWTVKGFSSCDARYLETLVKPVPTDPNLVFRIRLHPQGNKESNKDFTFFQVFCSNTQSRHKAKFTVQNVRGEELATTVYTGQQQLHGYFEYVRREALITHLAPSDELSLLLDLVISFETVTKSFHTRQLQVEPKQEEVTNDMENLFRYAKMSDFAISCSGQEIPCHKVMLAARSPVFAAMLEPHTEEAQNDCVAINDLDFDVLNEMLHYIYTGSAPNLKDMAQDLLAAADRFQLLGLKDMADQVLRHNLNIENSCRILVLADMHGAKELKQEATRYVAQHKSQIIQTDGWTQMITANPNLVTEIVSAIQTIESANSSPTAIGEPAAKRFRGSLSQ